MVNDQSPYRGVDYAGAAEVPDTEVSDGDVPAESASVPEPARVGRPDSSGAAGNQVVEVSGLLPEPEASQGTRPTGPPPPPAPPSTSPDDAAPVSPKQAASPRRKGISIEIWGAPRAGKTTFLRALPFAADEPVLGYRWNISGRDRPSRDFLLNAVESRLAGKFPAASSGAEPLAWKFRGVRHREPAWPWLPRWISEFMHDDESGPDIEFDLEVHDLSGELFGKSTVHRDLRDQMLERMVAARGIVLLFDPIGTKAEDTNAFDYYLNVVDVLKERVEARNGLLGNGQLPHHLSVCVTKLDDARVFEAAMAARVIYGSDTGSAPGVPAEFAPELLWQLSADDRSQRLCVQLERDFLRSRTRYYITSAAGFHLVDGRFDPGDPSNGDDGGLRSVADPVNVLEPIISLYQRITGEMDGM